jgi:UDP-N-acetyl-D-galactosamine dehydrogenase
MPNQKFDAVVLTVSHNKFKGLDYQSLKNNNAVLYDVKNFIDDAYVDGRL